MKKLMITGALLGFSSGLVLGLAQQSAWPFVLWRASVAALLAGLLLRWWGRIWVKSLVSIEERRLAAEAKASTDSPMKLSPNA